MVKGHYINFTEKCLEKVVFPKALFFPLRGVYPWILFVNLILLFLFFEIGDPEEDYQFIGLLYFWVLKLIYSMILACSSPGTIEFDDQMEKYISEERKDLAMIKCREC